MKDWYFKPKILKIHNLKYTNYNKYVAESRAILIRKLSSIRIERGECVKVSKHAKTCF